MMSPNLVLSIRDGICPLEPASKMLGYSNIKFSGSLALNITNQRPEPIFSLINGAMSKERGALGSLGKEDL